MKQDITNSNKYFLFFFFILLYLSLIIGFFYNEDSTGGAFLDYKGQKAVSESFAADFNKTLLNYDNFATRHSPILIIFLSIFEKINISDEFIRLIHLHLSLSLPFGFYLLLKQSISNLEKKYILIIVGLIFVSPTFRSLSIWPDSRLLGLSCFVYSLIFYILFLKTNKNIHLILNIFFYTVSAYISPNFAVFSLFFFYKYLKKYNFLDSKIIMFIILNILLCLPAFYYIFYLDINFLNKTAAITNQQELIFFNNISNQLLIIPTIFLFYVFPFFMTKILNINFENIRMCILISIITFVLCIFYFNYQYSFTGGGIFFKLSNYLFNNNYIFYLISFISILLVSFISIKNFDNLIIIFLLIISNPQVSIYHKYFDPLIMIILFSILNLNMNINRIKEFKNYVFIYLYFLSFLIISFIK